MKVLLTGITGNLGFEIARNLHKHEVDILPVVRDRRALDAFGLQFEYVIEADLTKEIPSINTGSIDCIIHSAGNVHFERSGGSNSKMMRFVTQIAKECGVPIYYVSTAFLWRESEGTDKYRNAYETDKLESEKILRDSGVAHTIFRPSVLVGSSESGSLRNWTGYYILITKFLEAAGVSSGTKIRFPMLTGTSDMVPIDQAAEVISETVTSCRLHELVYVTNPEPPRAQWVLDTTLKFFRIRDRFEFLDFSFADYEKYQRNSNEEVLYLTGKHFNPYWSLPYNFPASACKENLITEKYLEKTLRSFQVSNKIEIV